MSESANNAPPLYDFADKKSLTGLLRSTYKKFLQNTDDMLPAKIIAYDRAINRATVQPQIMVITTNQKLVSRTQYVNVPVFQFGGGNFLISFPMQAGNTGWIKASDRDISIFTQSYVEAPPNTFRLHSFENGMFFPDVMSGFTFDGEDADNMVIQTLDGTTKISIGIGTIKALAPTSFTIQSPEIMLNGNVSSTGTFTNNGQDISSTHTHEYSPGGDPPEQTGTPT